MRHAFRRFATSVVFCNYRILAAISLLVGFLFVGVFSAKIAVAQDTAASKFVFRDVARTSGLIPALSKLQAHGAGWGDADGDGWPDLYVATFHYSETGPNHFLKNHGGHFEVEQQQALRVSMRATGVVFADFDNDGDLDLYVASMPATAESRQAKRHGHPFRGCSLFENLGQGTFKDISTDNGACPNAFGGRSACVLDFDGDGLLDILVGEDPIPGYNGSKTKASRLFKNTGRLQFKDVTKQAGMPEVAGLGVAAADVNGDTWPDIFIASTLGNYLLLNDGAGRFAAAGEAEKVLAWPDAKGDDMVCGVAIADVNGDALPDVLIGNHFGNAWSSPVANRLYLNQGNDEKQQPRFLDVTEKAGLPLLPMKAPHVEIQDFDNDGFPDLYGSMVMFADGRPHPLICRNTGQLRNGLPQFRQTTLGVNNFPTEEDRQIRRSGTFFDKMLTERKVFYSAPGPSCDFNRDGRLDLFIGSWWSNANSMLLQNETPSGNWLDVAVLGRNDVNRMGIGSVVQVFEPGYAGEPKHRIGAREIATGFGYASSQEAVAHFGLGQRTHCDVQIILPHNHGTITKRQVAVNQRLTLSKGEPDAIDE